MTTITFDTLAYVKKLKAAGVPEKQAEVQAEALVGFVEEQLATKHDIELIRKDIELLRRDTDIRIAELKAELIKWMFGIAAGQVAIIVTLVKLL